MAPPSRQERLQMRQRGAGARKVDNVDFGLSFGLTPGKAQRSVSRTSRTSHTSVWRSSKTPSRNARRSSARRSVRSASATNGPIENLAQEVAQPLEDGGGYNEQPAAKRRKTKDRSTPELLTPADHLRSILAPNTLESKALSNSKPRSRRRTSGPAFVQIAEDPDNEAASEQRSHNSGVPVDPNKQVSDPNLENATVDKENAISDAEKSMRDFVTLQKPERKGKKGKKRKSIGQQSGRRKKRLSNESNQSVPEEPMSDTTVPEPREEEPEWETMIGDESGLLATEMSVSTHQTIAPSKKRRKRKSVVLKPKRRSVRGPADLAPPDNVHVRKRTEQSVPAKPTPNVRSDRATRRRASDASEIQTPGNRLNSEPEIEGDETYIDEAVSPEKPTPQARSKKAKEKTRKDSHSGSRVQSSTTGQSSSSSGLKKSLKATFPILTHRMTNVSALPTIHEDIEEDNGLDTEMGSLETKFTDRSAPNAIDVLAQICRETVSTTISKLSTGSSTISTRELKRKRSATEAFGAEIDSRLFDMSVAIEHRLTTEARARKARKAKTDAQNEWREIRRQREEIALKCDEVRATNSRIEADGKETYELSEQLHELEMVVEKPELDDVGGAGAGLDYLLRSMAQRVSGGAGDGGGLLDRVKEYNRQLERTALVLEGRQLD